MEKDAPDAKDKVMEMVKDLHVAMLSTRGPDGKFHSRPMAVSDATFQGSLYFLTEIESGKVHDLATYPETIVTFADPGQQKYVAMRGRGAITQDRAVIKDHWTAAARAWFPKGAEDPDIALIEVEIEEAEYWDAPSGKMVLLYAYAKAFVTGKRPGNIGENARVDMT